MGDKGGKKDKEKGQKQNAKKQQETSKKKLDKQPKRTPNKQHDEISATLNIVTFPKYNGNGICCFLLYVTVLPVTEHTSILTDILIFKS